MSIGPEYHRRDGSEPLQWHAQPMGARVDLEDKDAVVRALGSS